MTYGQRVTPLVCIWKATRQQQERMKDKREKAAREPTESCQVFVDPRKLHGRLSICPALYKDFQEYFQEILRIQEGLR